MDKHTFDRNKDIRQLIPADEPDDVRGRTRHGFQFIVKRNPWSGNLLGYIRIPKGHPWYKMSTRKKWYKARGYLAWGRFRVNHFKRAGYCALPFVEVHGGLTYCDKLSYKGMQQRGWWVGFDCVHYMDAGPIMGRTIGGSYRTFKFVLGQIDLLSSQMAEAR